MFGEISVLAWMGGAIMFAIGGATGFFISRQIKDKRTLELEEKLAATRNELAGYRGDVNQHFLKTSLLLGKLTNNYREVYEHLATGAQKLCNESTGTPKLDLPDTKILPTINTVETETPVLEQGAEPAAETAVDLHQVEPEKVEEAVELSAEAAQQVRDDVESKAPAAEKPSSANPSAEESTEQLAGRPAPEDIPDNIDNDEDVHLGAESAPSVDTELHKTHPSIH